MSLFNSYWKCNYDELVTFYPKYYREVFEMDAILQAEGKLADGIRDGIDLMLLNNFIDSADEETITKLEDFMNMSLMKQRPLEERRRFIKSHFAGQGKVSATRISEMIKGYTGADTKCTFQPFDEEKNNRLDIQFERGAMETIYLSDIYTLLAKMLPAHIEYRAVLTYHFPIGIGKRRNHYKNSYDLCGTKPYSVLVAHYDAIDATTEASASNCSVDYIPCGTIYSGQGG